MNKREKSKLIKDVWGYLQYQCTKAFEEKNESEFDWYSRGSQAFIDIIQGKPIEIVERIRPL